MALESPQPADLNREDWSRNEWGDYELWEKIEVRIRRRKRIWILSTVILFCILSSIPIVRDSMPTWAGSRVVSSFANEIVRIKTRVATEHRAFQVRFREDQSLEFEVLGASRCTDEAFSLIYTGKLQQTVFGKSVRRLTRNEAREKGYPGVIDGFCYDPIDGLMGSPKPEDTQTFAFEVESQISVLILTGPSAEISRE